MNPQLQKNTARKPKPSPQTSWNQMKPNRNAISYVNKSSNYDIIYSSWMNDNQKNINTVLCGTIGHRKYEQQKIYITGKVWMTKK